jgi:membrane-associated phospholipid phosphatase
MPCPDLGLWTQIGGRFGKPGDGVEPGNEFPGPGCTGSRRTTVRSVFALLVCLLAAAAGGGCSSGSDSRFSRHFDAGVWGGAFEQQIKRPDRWIPELAILATIPAAFAYDTEIQQHYEDQEISPTTKNVAAGFQVLLVAIPVTIGAVEWAGGDGGRNLEVVAETLVGVVAVQQILAHAVGRERPNEDDNLSFPSGHTSWAFATTTLIVRNLHDPSDTSFHAVDVLLYAPAMYGAWERIASNKHWASDVACGALLGVLLTNSIWDAHYGGHAETRPTIFAEERPRGMAWSPSLDVTESGVVLGIKADF